MAARGIGGQWGEHPHPWGHHQGRDPGPGPKPSFSWLGPLYLSAGLHQPGCCVSAFVLYLPGSGSRSIGLARQRGAVLHVHPRLGYTPSLHFQEQDFTWASFTASLQDLLVHRCSTDHRGILLTLPKPKSTCRQTGSPFLSAISACTCRGRHPCRGSTSPSWPSTWRLAWMQMPC